jgi:hypothetical protein
MAWIEKCTLATVETYVIAIRNYLVLNENVVKAICDASIMIGFRSEVKKN